MIRPTLRSTVLLLTLTALAAAACGDDQASTFDRSQMLADTGQEVILPTHAALRDGAVALHSATEAFCADRTEANLEVARQAWRDVVRPLREIQAWSFGPYKVFEVRMAQNVDKYPAQPDEIEAVLAGDDPISVDFVHRLDYRDRVKGYPALGYLLFDGDDAGETVSRYTSDEHHGERRCEYLVAVAEHARGIVETYEQRWSPEGGDYLGELVNAGQGSSAFGNPQEAIAALVNHMIFVTEDQLAMMKLGRPFGHEDGGAPRPDAVEAPFSNTSVAHMLENLDGVEKLYTGADQGLSLQDYTKFRQRSPIDQAVLDRINAARQAISQIPEPLAQSVIDQRAEVEAAISAVEALNVVLKSDLSTLLGITVTNVVSDND